MNTPSSRPDALLTTAEVAAILFVDPKTVVRWATSGKLSSIRTPGGHRRFLRAEVVGMITRTHLPQSSGPDPGSADAGEVENSRSVDLWEVGGTSRPVERVSTSDQLAAAEVVAEAVAIAREAMELMTAEAIITTERAVDQAAVRAADAAETARVHRAAAAAEAADAVATNAARTAASIQLQADTSAVQVSEAAAQAATVVAAAIPLGTDVEAASAALRLAATVTATAAATARDTADSAARVAHEVTAAATEVASAVTALDIAIGTEVARAAAAVQTRATAAARQMASDSASRASSVALAARVAVEATFHPGADRWQHTST